MIAGDANQVMGRKQPTSLARETTCVMQENYVQMVTAMIITAAIYTVQSSKLTIHLQNGIIEL